MGVVIGTQAGAQVADGTTGKAIGAAGSPATSEGKRKANEDSVIDGITPTARLNSRISNRVETRVQNRIGRFNYPQASALAPFKVSGANTRGAVSIIPQR